MIVVSCTVSALVLLCSLVDLLCRYDAKLKPWHGTWVKARTRDMIDRFIVALWPLTTDGFKGSREAIDGLV